MTVNGPVARANALQALTVEGPAFLKAALASRRTLESVAPTVCARQVMASRRARSFRQSGKPPRHDFVLIEDEVWEPVLLQILPALLHRAPFGRHMDQA